MDQFDEQIDKLEYFKQQGFGQNPLYISRQRGRGFMSLARRYAYPVFQKFMNFARPVVKDIFSEVKSAAQESVKKAAKQKLEDLVSKIDKQKGKGIKRRKIIKPRNLKKKNSLKNLSGGNRKKKLSKKPKKSKKSLQFNDIFK
jgi:hypothetical protein